MPDDNDFPGMPQRYWPLLLLYPGLLLLGVAVSFFVPSLPEWLPFLAAFLIASIILGTVAVVDTNRKRRRAGLVPKNAGNSAMVEVLAARLRDRADEIEQAIRFGRPISSARTLQGYLEDARKIASREDHRNLVPTLRLYPSDPDHEAHISKLRQSAAELDAYVVELRQRPPDPAMEGSAAGCTAVSVGFAIAGGWLVWHGWPERGPKFWWGGVLVGIAAVFLWLIRMVLNEPA
ncbi:MAG TPA: hypothetical protein VII12_16720 [Thermoanaerobaculia bacterium]